MSSRRRSKATLTESRSREGRLKQDDGFSLVFLLVQISAAHGVARWLPLAALTGLDSESMSGALIRRLKQERVPEKTLRCE